MNSLGSKRKSSNSSSSVVSSVSVGEELILKGVGLVRVLKVESEELNLYLVKDLKTLEIIEVSSNQLTHKEE